MDTDDAGHCQKGLEVRKYSSESDSLKHVITNEALPEVYRGSEDSDDLKYVIAISGESEEKICATGTPMSQRVYPWEPTQRPSQFQTTIHRGFLSRRRTIILLMLVLIILVVVIAVPVGVMTSNRRESGDRSESSGGSDNSTLADSSDEDLDQLVSASNVLLGSRMSAMTTAHPLLQTCGMLFYQTVDRGINYIEIFRDGRLGNAHDLTVNDARNNTPIASIWSKDQDSPYVVWNLFYVDQANVIHNMYTNEDHSGWKLGSLSEQRWQASEEAAITFAGFPGTEFSEFPVVGSFQESLRMGGGRTFLACDDTDALRQYSWNEDNRAWHDNGQVDSSCTNGAATTYHGVGYHFRLQNDSVNFGYRNFADSGVAGSSWNYDGLASPIPAANPGNVCAFGPLSAYLTPENTIRASELNVSLDARDGSNTRWPNRFLVADSDDIMPNTALACFNTAPDNFQPERHYVFYQLRNGTIQRAMGTVTRRPYFQISWAYDNL